MVNKVKKKKGFTLVELLAVIIILAIILVIAVPQLMETIEKSRKSTLELSAKKIASAAEAFYISNQSLGKDEEITCSSVAELTSEDYESCNIQIDNGKATVTIVGSGKFEGLSVCEATRDSAEVTEGVCSTTLASGETFNLKIRQLVNPSLTADTLFDEPDTTITSIEILGNGTLPEGYTKETLTALTSKVDVSEKEDNSVLAYYDGNGKVYVYSEGPIKANEDASIMFAAYANLTNLDVSTLDTSNVTYMDGMFEECSSLTTIDLSTLDTSKVTYMAFMFAGCSSLTIIDLSNFDTSNVTDMEGMFAGCSSLTTIDVSNFDTSKVTYMSYMFTGCSSLTTIDFSNADFSNATEMYDMFNECTNLTTIYVKDCATTHLLYEKTGSMLGTTREGACVALASGETFNAKIKQLVNTSATYNTEDTTITSIEILGNGTLPEGYTKETLTALTSKVDVSANEDNSIVAYYDNGKVYVYSEGKIVANPDASCMFGWFTNLTNLDVSTLDTSKVTNMEVMFGWCSSLTTIDLSNFDTSKVTNMGGMFRGCSSLTTIDFSNADFSNVDGACMFSDTDNLDLSTIRVKDAAARSFIDNVGKSCILM